jgi:hypothetical protein
MTDSSSGTTNQPVNPGTPTRKKKRRPTRSERKPPAGYRPPATGYVMVPAWLVRKCPSPRALQVYVALGLRGTFRPGAATYMKITPAYETISWDISEPGALPVSRDTVRNAVRELETLGALVRVVREGQRGDKGVDNDSNEYRLIFGEVIEPAAGGVSRLTPGPGGEQDHPRGGEHVNPTGGEQAHPNPEPVDPKPDEAATQLHLAAPDADAPARGNDDGRKKRAPNRTPRPADPIWDAVMGACSVPTNEKLTPSSRGRYNRAVAELKAAEATPEEIVVRARRYTAKWPDVSLTPNALASRWPELAVDPPPRRNGHRPPPRPGNAYVEGNVAERYGDLFA